MALFSDDLKKEFLAWLATNKYFLETNVYIFIFVNIDKAQ